MRNDVRRAVEVDVAVARARLDDGDRRVLQGVLDEPCAAAGDDAVDDAVHAHEAGRALARGVLDELDELAVHAGRADGVLDDAGDRDVRADGVFTAAQHDGVAALDGEADGVCRDVGARFIDDADDAQRHAHAAQLDAVVHGALLEHLPDGAGERDELFQPDGDAVDALFVQHQAIDELRAARAARHVDAVFGDDLIGARAQCGGGGREHRVALRFARAGDDAFVFFGPQAGLFHSDHSSLRLSVVYAAHSTMQTAKNSMILPKNRGESGNYSSSSSSGRSTLW